MFVAHPPGGPAPRRDLQLVRAARRAFDGPAGFLADPENRARVGVYLTDMARAYGREVPAPLFGEPPSPALGHSYGEMGEVLIGLAVPAGEPVDLLVLAFSVHDVRPGRQTAAYLSHLTPGAPMAFAVCDQGSAAAFTGLRIAREYASSAGVRRALLIVVEQAALPYDCPVPLPSRHQGVAMLYGAMPQEEHAGPAVRVAGVRQHPDVPAADVARLAAADLTELAASRRNEVGRPEMDRQEMDRQEMDRQEMDRQEMDRQEMDHPEVGLVLGDALAGVWTGPAAGRVRVMPPGQPSTGVWWGLLDELDGDGGHPDLLVVADYDPGLRYLCLTAFDTGPLAHEAEPSAVLSAADSHPPRLSGSDSHPPRGGGRGQRWEAPGL